MNLSVVVPLFNGERTILSTLRAIRKGAPQAEIIVADGGSTDRGAELARGYCKRLITVSRGRARQLNAAAAVAAGDVLGFVHADTLVPPTYAGDIETALDDPRVVGGRFDIEFDDSSAPLRVIALLINGRSRLTRVASGDHAIFIRRSIFEKLGGFAEIDHCEDIELARRLKHLGELACLASRVITPARCWQNDGLPETILRKALMSVFFYFGIDSSILNWLDPHHN
jgi:rSAM/selenodomain-associated transferase 2